MSTKFWSLFLNKFFKISLLACQLIWTSVGFGLEVSGQQSGVWRKSDSPVKVSSSSIPLAIKQAPESMTVDEGDMVILTVAAQGTEPLQYQWRFNGQEISGARSNAYILSNILTNQAGNYRVTVSDISGSITSPPASLMVVSLPSDLPRLTIAKTEGGLKLDYWLRNKKGFYHILQSDQLEGLHKNSNVFITAPIPAIRRGSLFLTNRLASASRAQFILMRETREFLNQGINPFFTQNITPSPFLQTIECGEGVKIEIPANCVKAQQMLKVSKLTNLPPLPVPAGLVIGQIFDISLGSQQTFDAPVTIEIPYSTELLNPDLPIKQAVMAIYWNTVDNVWSVAAGTPDPQRKLLIIKTRHLSLWGSAYVARGYKVLTDPQEEAMVVFHPANSGLFSGQGDEVRRSFAGEEFARLGFDYLTNAISVFRRQGFSNITIPVWVFLDPKYTEAEWSGYTGNIYLPLEYKTEAEFRSTMGHELFHSIQSSYYSSVIAGYFGKWWHEACAEYAGNRLAAGKSPIFQSEYVLSDFLHQPLTRVDESHEYGAANFLDYIFTHAGQFVTFKGQFDELSSSSMTEYLLDRFDAYIERQTVSQHLLSTLFISFADEFYLNKTGIKPYLNIWKSTATINEKPGAELYSSMPSLEHSFNLTKGYTAKILTVRISTKSDQPTRSLRVICVQGPGNDSGIVRMFKNSADPRFSDTKALTDAGWTLGIPGTEQATNYVTAAEDDYISIIAYNTSANIDSTVTVRIEDATTSISINPSSAEINLSGSATFKATVQGYSNQEVKWTVYMSSGFGYSLYQGAEITPGKVGEASFKFPKVGSFKIVAESVADPTLKAEATVKVIRDPINVTIVKSSLPDFPDVPAWSVQVTGGVLPFQYRWQAYNNTGRIYNGSTGFFYVPTSYGVPTVISVGVTDSTGNFGYADLKLTP